jgi:hypothetical protein
VLEMGESTCASAPGKFCRMVRTRSFGQKFFCALHETDLFDDEDGWLQRCPECLKEFPETAEGA